MGNWAAPMATGDARLQSVVVVCVGHSPITTTAVVDGSICFPPVESLNDAATVLCVQFYLRCKRARLPTMPHEDKAWEWFFARCDPVVRRSLAACGRPATLLAHRDDLRQEVWGEVLNALPRLDRDRLREGIEPWLAGLARRKARRVARSLANYAVDRFVAFDDGLADSLPSGELGPEEVCLLREATDRFRAAVAELRNQTSPTNCEIFRRRFFLRQSVAKISAALGLSCPEVRWRCHRARRKWEAIAQDAASLGCVSFAKPHLAPSLRSVRK